MREEGERGERGEEKYHTKAFRIFLYKFMPPGGCSGTGRGSSV